MQRLRMVQAETCLDPCSHCEGSSKVSGTQCKPFKDLEVVSRGKYSKPHGLLIQWDRHARRSCRRRKGSCQELRVALPLPVLPSAFPGFGAYMTVATLDIHIVCMEEE